MLKVATIILLTTTSAQAACHKYSHWAYPYPQPLCGSLGLTAESPEHKGGRASLAARNAPVWYVEITAIPTSSFQGNEDVVAKSKDELNMLLLSQKWAKTLQKSWTDNCLLTSTPEQCKSNWEKLNRK